MGPSPAPPAADRSIPGRYWLVLAAVGVVTMLVGAVGATTLTLVLVGGGQPEHRYDVRVFLDPAVTVEQRRAVEAALPALDPVDGVRWQSREQAWEKFKEQYRDRPDLLDAARPESMSESFELTTTGTVFDCATLAPVRRLPGVHEVSVVQRPTEGRPGALLEC